MSLAGNLIDAGRGFFYVGSGQAAVVHAGIGGGKSTTAAEAARLLRARSFRVSGLLSHRVYEGTQLIGYDLEDLGAERSYPLVRLSSLKPGDGWETHGNPIYSFSVRGFDEANGALRRAAAEAGVCPVIFVDEYGRLESRGLGLAPGALAVFASLAAGASVAVLCRTGMITEVEGLLHPWTGDVSSFPAGDPAQVAAYLAGDGLK